MVKIVIDGSVKISMKDGEEDIAEQNDSKFSISKKDDDQQSIVGDLVPSGMIEINTESCGQDISFLMSLPDLAKCIKFLEN